MLFLICSGLTKVLKFSFGLLLVQEFEFSDMLIVSFLQYFSMLILHLFNCVQMLILLFRKFLSVLLFQILVLQDSFLNLIVMLLALLFQSLKMIILSIRNVNFQILNLNLQTFNHFHILLVLLTVSIGINHNFLTCFNNFYLQTSSLIFCILEILFELVAIKFNIIDDSEFFIQSDQSYFHSFNFNVSFTNLELKLVCALYVLIFFCTRTIYLGWG